MAQYSVEIKNITVPSETIQKGETRIITATADDSGIAVQHAIRKLFGNVASMSAGRNSDGSEYRTITGKGNPAKIYGKIYAYAAEIANA